MSSYSSVMKACLWWLSSILQWTGDLTVCFWKDQVQIWLQLLIFFYKICFMAYLYNYNNFYPFLRSLIWPITWLFWRGSMAKYRNVNMFPNCLHFAVYFFRLCLENVSCWLVWVSCVLSTCCVCCGMTLAVFC